MHDIFGSALDHDSSLWGSRETFGTWTDEDVEIIVTGRRPNSIYPDDIPPGSSIGEYLFGPAYGVTLIAAGAGDPASDAQQVPIDRDRDGDSDADDRAIAKKEADLLDALRDVLETAGGVVGDVYGDVTPTPMDSAFYSWLGEQVTGTTFDALVAFYDYLKFQVTPTIVGGVNDLAPNPIGMPSDLPQR